MACGKYRASRGMWETIQWHNSCGRDDQQRMRTSCELQDQARRARTVGGCSVQKMYKRTRHCVAVHRRRAPHPSILNPANRMQRTGMAMLLGERKVVQNTFAQECLLKTLHRQHHACVQTGECERQLKLRRCARHANHSCRLGDHICCGKKTNPCRYVCTCE